MWSIALFPCSYTNGATIIGELIHSLHLPVYTDAMLFSEVSEQFGISAERLHKITFERLPALHRYLLKKEKYINCMKCSLGAQLMNHPKGRLHYGLHTSLLDSQNNLVLKVLVFDDEECRVKRAMQQEGFTERIARNQVRRDDEKVSDWTNFLFHKQAYDRSLYDVVINLRNKYVFEIATEIVAYFRATANLENLLPDDGALPVLDNQLNMGEQMGWVG
ncbi:MAG: cytidylate kinase-like family protein [Proteobacteria bacterium]|nr:cytidylate kinase-like family protein [Pseudomonadota bacterium]